MALIAYGAILAVGAARYILQRRRSGKNALALRAPADQLLVENDGAELHVGMLVCFTNDDGKILGIHSAVCTRLESSWELRTMCPEPQGVEGEPSYVRVKLLTKCKIWRS